MRIVFCIMLIYLVLNCCVSFVAFYRVEDRIFFDMLIREFADRNYMDYDTVKNAIYITYVFIGFPIWLWVKITDNIDKKK